MIKIENVDHLTTTGMVEGKCSSDNPKDTQSTNWLNVGQVTRALEAKRSRDMGNS